MHNSGCPLGHKGNDIEAFLQAMDVAESDSDSVSAQDGTLSIESVVDSIPGLKKITV